MGCRTAFKWRMACVISITSFPSPPSRSRLQVVDGYPAPAVRTNRLAGQRRDSQQSNCPHAERDALSGKSREK